MKYRISFIGTYFVILIISFLLLFSCFIHATEEEETIEGTVVIVEWDDDDNVSAVAISVVVQSDDPEQPDYFEDYLVLSNEKGKELFSLVGETVKATGKVEKDHFSI